MKILENKIKPIKITIVCCVHGDETFGKEVFDYYRNNIKKYEGLRVILANTLALKRNVRFLDEDLNRVFPGNLYGNREQRLAAKILPFIKSSQYLLDIHTTTSYLKMTPIVVALNKKVKDIINLCKSSEVVLMNKSLSKHALIGQAKSGVSLEFGEKYARKPDALKEVVSIVENLFSGRHFSKKGRKIFKVSSLISKEINLPRNAKNFAYLSKYKIYPFLLNEKSYINHQGFAAKKYVDFKI